MIDKITAKIKRYPFQTGIIVGVVVCLLLVGFISLFQDNGRTLADNAEIIREDYLRMTINEFGRNADSDLAGWRYAHLGRSGDETLSLMRGDESIAPQLLVSFTDAVNRRNILTGSGADGSQGVPTSPRKGLSGFGKTLLIIICLLVVCAAALYAASMIKTRKKQQRRSEVNRARNDEPVNVITPEKARSVAPEGPDTLFDLDSLFPEKSGSEEKTPAGFDIPEPVNRKIVSLKEEPEEEPDNETEVTADNENIDELIAESQPEIPDENSIEETEAEKPAESAPEETEETGETHEEPAEEDEQDSLIPEAESSEAEPEKEEDEEEIQSQKLNFETEKYDLDSVSVPEDEPAEEIREEKTEEPIPMLGDDPAEKPLVETDTESDPDNDDELLKMIRNTKTNSAAIADRIETDEKPAEEEAEMIPEPEGMDTAEDNTETPTSDDDSENSTDILIHYQSTYRLGNDMYDEVFSIDQGDVFRGECGIGIGETLNNTEPKAVTAFELWLFDKDDIHTATWYLMSDFALENEGILERLQQHGKCEMIRKNGVYNLETETLTVEVKVLDLEYGTEMEEKNSYFTNVTFDVIARSK